MHKMHDIFALVRRGFLGLLLGVAAPLSVVASSLDSLPAAALPSRVQSEV